MERRSVAVFRIPILFALVAAAAALPACRGGDDAAPRWRGSFTRAISTCGTSLTPFALVPPREAVVESAGDFAPGNRVNLFLEDGCPLAGTIDADGRLLATIEPGCPAAGAERIRLLVEDVFAPETVIHQTTDHADPQQCGVEVWGTFTRE